MILLLSSFETRRFRGAPPEMRGRGRPRRAFTGASPAGASLIGAPLCGHVSMSLDALSPLADPAAASPPRRAFAPAPGRRLPACASRRACLVGAGALAAVADGRARRRLLRRSRASVDARAAALPLRLRRRRSRRASFALLALAETALGPTLLDALRALAVLCDAASALGLLMLGRRFGQPLVGLFAALSFPVLNELVTANDAYSPLAAPSAIFAFVAALSRRGLLRRARSSPAC